MKYLFPIIIVALSFLVTEKSFALKPSKIYVAVPDTMHLPYEKNTIATKDGFKLQSWTFLPSNADKHTTLVIAIGDGGNMSGYINYGAMLSQSGYTVCMFDYRGFGASDDFAINTDQLYYNEFVKDLEAAMLFAREKYKGNSTGILAFSMGTAITVLAAPKAKPDFIIGDSFITDVIMVQDRIEKLKNKKIIVPDDAKEYHNKLLQIKTPMMIFSGTKDVITTEADVDALKKEKPAIPVIKYEGGHMQAFTVMTKDFLGSEYIHAIDNFLKK